MSYRSVELACAPGRHVSGPRAMRLVESRKARFDDQGKLVLLAGTGSYEQYVEERVHWTEQCAGYLMNGRAINHA